MDHGLSKVGSQYGAPMGRGENRGDADTAYNIVIRKVDLTEGYDVGGAYWGTPNNLWRYFADPVFNEDTQTESEGIEHFERAIDYDDVKAMALFAYPNAKIIPDSIDDEYRETFTESYIDTAIEDGSDRGGEDSEDLNLDGLNSSDLADEARAKMEADCKAFIDANAETLTAVMENMGAGDAGYNFYMSRQGHGVGFWDRGLGANGEKLHDACKHREIYLYKDEDGKIHHE